MCLWFWRHLENFSCKHKIHAVSENGVLWQSFTLIHSNSTVGDFYCRIKWPSICWEISLSSESLKFIMQSEICSVKNKAVFLESWCQWKGFLPTVAIWFMSQCNSELLPKQQMQPAQEDRPTSEACCRGRLPAVYMCHSKFEAIRLCRKIPCVLS